MTRSVSVLSSELLVSSLIEQMFDLIVFAVH